MLIPWLVWVQWKHHTYLVIATQNCSSEHPGEFLQLSSAILHPHPKPLGMEQKKKKSFVKVIFIIFKEQQKCLHF